MKIIMYKHFIQVLNTTGFNLGTMKLLVTKSLLSSCLPRGFLNYKNKKLN